MFIALKVLGGLYFGFLLFSFIGGLIDSNLHDLS